MIACIAVLAVAFALLLGAAYSVLNANLHHIANDTFWIRTTVMEIKKDISDMEHPTHD